MAGNSQRRGATRKAGSKKGATVGTGGKNRRALEGKGPTPKAEDRPYHVAAKRKAAAERLDAAKGRGRRPVAGEGRSAPETRTTSSRPSRPGGASGRGSKPAAGAEIVAGRNSVVEALRAGVPCTGVWVGHRIDADDRIREILKLTTDRGLPLLEVTKPELDRLTDGLVHQGVAIQVPPYQYAGLDALLARAERTREPALVVALDGVTDPRNLGAVLRSAGAFGAHGVVVPERRAAGVTASAWKVSAGAAARVPVARVTNLVRALTELRDAGCFVVGLDAGGTMEIGDLQLATGPVVLVVGSEGKGLGRLVRETCDVVASIPIRSAVESLNAGVAAGISLYEVARLRAQDAG
ncbi:23S rRNA (guanosine(2251)-2'-O)-methyltransferase RlmB [Actinotalea ferrariae]|uniref:23S rRNA (guanosine(2251)-2'-O)-methyltransferase RlmB n=1 Tax=Actinotalea ferrariae TaxID=1386098 RepID=UPI001C8BCBEA|nr:23S rRNA (guanosine(2251)-2'-O)-methyltransferase RlmB [Actinotalea ferrariae]MBX9244475.1 23S rRNA (guanosine(2251)-2'-O)-methyltransferase RlmB [Actinotalea ferrariae]